MLENEGGKNDPGKRNGKNDDNSQAGWWLIVVAGLILLGVVGLVGLTLIEHKDRVNFLTVNALSVLIAEAVAMQVYIYRQQWKIMQEQKRMAAISERAYVYVENVKLLPLEIMAQTGVDIVLLNAGRTPAREVHCTAEMVLTEPTHAPEDHVQKPAFIRSRGVFIPAGRTHEAQIFFDLAVDDADIFAIGRYELTLFVVGTISYWTVQDEAVSESFCVRWNSEAQRFEACERDDSREE